MDVLGLGLGLGVFCWGREKSGWMFFRILIMDFVVSRGAHPCRSDRCGVVLSSQRI